MANSIEFIYVPVQIDIWVEENGRKRFVGYIREEDHNIKWCIWSRENDLIYSGSSREDCDNSIHLLEQWWIEERDDLW